MPWTNFGWEDDPDTDTPLSSAKLEEFGEHIYDAATGASQPVDSDLTAIAALSTTSYGRAFLALADAAAGRTALGLGTAATSASGAFQPADSDLTAIAALTTTSFGRAFLAMADAAAARAALGTGTPSAGTYLDGAGTWEPLPAQGGSGLPANVRPITANATAVAGDILLANATSGVLTVTLPTSPATGALVTVIKTDSSANAVNVAGTVNGDAGGLVLGGEGVGAILEHVGSNAWWVVADALAVGDVEAGDVSFTPAAGLSSTDVQAAIAEVAALIAEGGTVVSIDGVEQAAIDLETDAATIRTAIGAAAASDLTAHTGDTSDAHDASAISYAGGTGMSATDVEAAIDELATEKANAADLTAHTGDTSDAHDASAISVVAITGVTGSDVQAVLEDLKDQVDGAGGGGGTSLNNPDPSMFGYKTWSYDMAMLSGAAEAPAAGVVELIRLPWRSTLALTQMTLMASELGSGEMANVYKGLYIKVGTDLILIGKTANLASSLDYNVNFHTLTVEGGQSLTVTADTVLYGAILIGTQGVTTQKFYKTTVNNQNGGVTDGLYRSGKYGTGQSALPSTIAIGSMTSHSFTWWMAAN